ncbi:hypothetical protein BNJ_00359 [Kaumoebavirus]|uniref:hypothetical protein n=1 Tax=Kaumoebavirus TaxID=1859492 RepID=UPI0009C3CAF3|nr:hypothetical protein BNJ_00359 [Kaumoebavirus]ARA72179.1 hypothetical protein BNJ_00359 [Kaumoebavirus]
MFDFKDDGDILYDGDDVERLRRRMAQKRDQLARQQQLEATDPARAKDEAIINEVVELAKKNNSIFEGLTAEGHGDKALKAEAKKETAGLFDLLPIKSPSNNIDNDLDMEIQKHLEEDDDSHLCCGGLSPTKSTTDSSKVLKELALLKAYHKVQAKMLGAYIEKIEKRLQNL